MSGEGVVVVIPPELETGFQLVGVETVASVSAENAIAQVEHIVDEGRRGVIAVHESFLAGVLPERRAALEGSVSPVVVPLPTGLEEHDEATHRARISAMLSRAVGYHITFGEEVAR